MRTAYHHFRGSTVGNFVTPVFGHTLFHQNNENSGAG